MDVRRGVIPLVLAVVLLGASCNKQDSTDQAGSLGTISTPISGTVDVSIENFAFSPNTLVVKKGTVLNVTNNDSTAHSLTAGNGSFDTGILSNGKSKTLTLESVGSFDFHCTPHPSMTGTVTVVE